MNDLDEKLTNRQVLANLITCANCLFDLKETDNEISDDLTRKLRDMYYEINYIYSEFYKTLSADEVKIPLEKLSNIKDKNVQEAYIDWDATSAILYSDNTENLKSVSHDVLGYNWLEDEEFLTAELTENVTSNKDIERIR